MKTLKLLLLLVVLPLFNSCGLKPISSEYTFVKTDIDHVNIDELGDGNVLIYSGANILHTVDNTARLNVWIDNIPLGQIRPSEYAILNFKPKAYQFKLLHIDFVNMKSEHTVEIDKNTKVIMIKPTVTSNKLEVTNQLPPKFEKYKYAEKR
ncbi:hypothetical protein ACFFVB_12030 [Formosa undariae]|uniref:DUF2846 domain-containing protein n=1 Tax=Formosa undariae TaxID=1325436 RepID=A0ABV5F2Y5_9FLAO